jgi:hypothetical protein
MKTVHQQGQELLEAMFTGLIAIEAVPKNFVVYMYYASHTHGKAEAFTFSTSDIPFHIRNEVSAKAIQKLRNGIVVQCATAVIAVYGGTVEKGRLAPLPADALDALAIVIGGPALHLTTPLRSRLANESIVKKYFQAMQRALLFKSMRKKL